MHIYYQPLIFSLVSPSYSKEYPIFEKFSFLIIFKIYDTEKTTVLITNTTVDSSPQLSQFIFYLSHIFYLFFHYVNTLDVQKTAKINFSSFALVFFSDRTFTGCCLQFEK